MTKENRVGQFSAMAWALVAAAMAVPATAATYTWTATANGNFSSAANWDAAGIPVTDGTADVVIGNASNNITVTVDSAWGGSSVNSVTFFGKGSNDLNAGSGVTVLNVGAGGINNPNTGGSANPGGRTINVNIPLHLTATQTWNIGSINGIHTPTILKGNLSSDAGVVVTKTGTGRVAFMSGNSTGFQGSFILKGGELFFGAASQYGRLGSNPVTVSLSSTDANAGIAFGGSGNTTFANDINITTLDAGKQFGLGFGNYDQTGQTATLSGNISGTLPGGSWNFTNLGGTITVAHSNVYDDRYKIVLTGDNSGLSAATAWTDANGKALFAVRRSLLVVDSDNALGSGNDETVILTDKTGSAAVVSGLLARNGRTVNSKIVLDYNQYHSNAAATAASQVAMVGLDGSGTATFTGDILIATRGTASSTNILQLTAGTGGTAIFDSKIRHWNSDANKGWVRVMAKGDVVLNGTNTYQSETAIREGRLLVGNASALGTATSNIQLGETITKVINVKAATIRAIGEDSALNTGGVSWTSMAVDGSGNSTALVKFNKVLTTLDGATLVDGDYILVKDETFDGMRMGVWQVTLADTVNNAGKSTMKRIADMDNFSEVLYGLQVRVASGTINGGKNFFLGNRTWSSASVMNTTHIGFNVDGVNQDVALLTNGAYTVSRNIDVNDNASTGKSILGGNTADVSEFAGTVTLNKALTVTAASGGEARFSGNITGGFGITKEGAGKVSFDGNKTYTGVTAVTAGVLEVNGNLASTQVDIVAGGTLAGSGNLAGVVVSNGGTLSPGNSPGTMTIAGLTLDAASNLNYDLKANDLTVGAGVNDLININGNLTLAGTLNVAVYGGTELSFGTYRLMNYTGTLTNNTLQLAGGLSATRTYQIDTNTAGQVNLVVSAIPEPASLGLLTFGSVLIAGRPRNPRKFMK